jgi:hypothetical protein
MTLSLLDVKFIVLIAALGFIRSIIPSRYYLALGIIGSATLLGLASVQSLLVVGGIAIFYLHPCSEELPT